MVLLWRKLHRLLYLTSVVLLFLPFYPILYFFARNPSRYFHQIVVIRRWITVASLYLVGIRFEVHYDTEIDWSKPYVICPNHTSILDITALTYLCPQDFSFIGKIELLSNPFIRIFFDSIDIAVDRADRRSALLAFKRGIQTLEHRKSLVVFPEGKIDDEYPPRLHPFKSGAFRLATTTGTTLLPVVIHNAWELFWDDGKTFGMKAGTIRISVLAPIAVNENSAENTHGSIEATIYDKMNQRWSEGSVSTIIKSEV